LAQRRFLPLLGGLLVALSPVLAQGRDARRPTFGVSSDLVVLSVTAVDGRGRPVRDLQSRELSVFENGRAQKLLHFSQGEDVPCRVLLLVDASGSMGDRDRAASWRMAARQVLAALQPADQVALAGFDSRYFGLVPFTRDRQAVEKGFDELFPFGATALHDALDHAARDLASHGEGRRAVVVVTDGVDTASQKAPEDVLASARALDVPIYALSVVSPLDDPASPLYTGREAGTPHAQGRTLLVRYAQLSGGAAFTVSDFRGLYQAAARITGELKHQYRLGYDPPQGPPGFRRIEVRTTRKGVVVRTRSGYVPPS
jgi:Ca-activated chloride channel family protein